MAKTRCLLSLSFSLSLSMSLRSLVNKAPDPSQISYEGDNDISIFYINYQGSNYHIKCLVSLLLACNFNLTLCLYQFSSMKKCKQRREDGILFLLLLLIRYFR